MHDASHNSAAKNKRLNNSIGLLCGCCCFLPFYQWKKLHLKHHRWAGNIDQDPSMEIINKFPQLNSSYVKRLDFCWHHWLPYLALMQHFVFWRGSYREAKESFKRGSYKELLVSFLVPVVIYSLALSVLQPKDLLFIAPALALYLVIVEVINFPHHLQLPQFHDKKRLTPQEQFLVSRSCHYPYWISYYLLNNFNYHTEHHLYPSMPWYLLHEIRPLIKSDLKDSYNESPHFAWILENRQLSTKELLAPIQPDETLKKVS